MNKLFFLLLGSVLVACGGSTGDGNTSGGAGTGAGTGTGTGTGSGSGAGTGTSTDPTSPFMPPTTTPLPVDASPCVQTTHALCQKACACTGTGACVVAYGTGVTEEHDSLSDCQDFYTHFVCNQPDRARDYAEPACGAALGSVACVATKSKGEALDFPVDACKAAPK
jgi:hypothetical protein